MYFIEGYNNTMDQEEQRFEATSITSYNKIMQYIFQATNKTIGSGPLASEKYYLRRLYIVIETCFCSLIPSIQYFKSTYYPQQQIIREQNPFAAFYRRLKYVALWRITRSLWRNVRSSWNGFQVQRKYFIYSWYSSLK